MTKGQQKLQIEVFQFAIFDLTAQFSSPPERRNGRRLRLRLRDGFGKQRLR